MGQPLPFPRRPVPLKRQTTRQTIRLPCPPWHRCTAAQVTIPPTVAIPFGFPLPAFPFENTLNSIPITYAVPRLADARLRHPARSVILPPSARRASAADGTGSGARARGAREEFHTDWSEGEGEGCHGCASACA